MKRPRRFFLRPRRGWPARLAGALALAATLAATLPGPAAAQELGRLFFTPERREALERQRQFDIPERRRDIPEIPETAEEPALTIDGVVTRSGGRRTVWINGVARDDRDDQDAADGVAVIPDRAHPGKVVVRRKDGADIRASVGDTVKRNTGETAGLLGEGWIEVKGAPR
ncbi:MAG: hypothetical protein LBS49_01485 [Candidatus Accumulibacter sp.]|jgi:hypothetical protein|nr:hypothetical protein [Accumulibacter sp.]